MEFSSRLGKPLCSCQTSCRRLKAIALDSILLTAKVYHSSDFYLGVRFSDISAQRKVHREIMFAWHRLRENFVRLSVVTAERSGKVCLFVFQLLVSHRTWNSVNYESSALTQVCGVAEGFCFGLPPRVRAFSRASR